MTSPVLSALIPVVLLIAIGFLAGRWRWIGPVGAKELSSLVFVVLTPPLLFRTMSTVHVTQLDFRPVACYLITAALIFFGTLANTFSNTVMIGIPLVGLAYGDAGLVVLFTLISVHSLLLLTTATVVLEIAQLREEAARGGHSERAIAHTVLLAVRNAVIHPVPLPIIAGLLFAGSGLALPAVLDKPLQMLGNAFGPLALLLVGVTLSGTRVGEHWCGALVISASKNLLHPALVAALGWVLGVSGIPLAAMVLAAALPIGANVFLFSQRYQVAEDLVTASVAMSTVLSLATLSLVMALLA